MGQIRMTTVSSSNLEKLGYVDDSRIMTVTFKGGSKYEYTDVTPEEYEHLIGADSVGKAFNAWLKEYKGTTINLAKQDVHRAIKYVKEHVAMRDEDAVTILELLGVKDG